MSIHVNADNFTRAETDRMFADIQRDAGAVNTFRHSREPAAIDAQTVIRLNRDTLYSFAIVDLSAGATVTVPDAGERYLSIMVVDHDHYVRAVLHGAGEYDLADYAPDSDYVLVAARTLVDSDDPADLAAVAAVQDELRLEVGSAVPSRARSTTRRPWMRRAPPSSRWPRACGRSSARSAPATRSIPCAT
jgi:hypothetical protein